MYSCCIRCLFCFSLCGDVDISRACSADIEPIETGHMTLTVEVLVGDSQLTEVITTNNYKTFTVAVNCQQGMNS